MNEWLTILIENHSKRLNALLYILLWSFSMPIGIAQPASSNMNQHSWPILLKLSSERVNEAPIPPPKYLRRRWEWQQKQDRLRRSQSAGRSKETTAAPQDSLFTKLQSKLWNTLGQASISPLYESPQERNQRRATMDLETKGTPILPSYTHEFIPTIYPHKRMTSWNTITEEGNIAVNIGGLTEIESIEMSTISSCIRGDLLSEPTQDAYLSLGERMWATPHQLDINCLRDECLRQGTACFIGIFSLKDWRDFTQPRGIASVSPEQSLLSLNPRASVILSQDDAGNFYISASPDAPLEDLDRIALMVSAPRAYFSGSWRSSLSLSELKDHPNLELPIDLKREALRLNSQLFSIDENTPFEELIFKLTDYFRSFIPGEQPKGEGSVYKRLMLSQIGVCRHRSYAFVVTARALGIPTRYLTNQVHAFAEILDPSGRWRRVDLGGEGIAPEDTRLTQSLLTMRSNLQTPYRPDDGLPRPPNYQSSAEQVNQRRSALSDQSYAESESTQTQFTTPKDKDQTSTQTISHNKSTDEANGQEVTDHSNNTEDTPIATQKNRSSELDLNVDPSPVPQSQDESLPPQSSPPSQATHDKALYGLKPQADHQCSKTLPGPTRLAQRAQMLMLSSLRQRLGQPRSSLTHNIAMKITLRATQQRTLHRCDLLSLRGKVTHKKRGNRKGLNGTWVLSGIKSKSDGKILAGWGQVNVRGYFNFKAQLPAKVSPGDYQLFIYFPAQKGHPEGWSELEE